LIRLRLDFGQFALQAMGRLSSEKLLDAFRGPHPRTLVDAGAYEVFSFRWWLIFIAEIELETDV